MILACGTCTHWMVWTSFPAATPWAVAMTAWFLLLSVIVTLSRRELIAVPRLPGAIALVVGSLILGLAIAGPVAGLSFAPSCLLGSLSAFRRSSRVRNTVLSLMVVAVAVLGGLWVWSNAKAGNLDAVERILLIQDTPVWPLELRRVGRGDCAALASVVERASTERLIAAAKRRLAEECPAPR